jgi:2-dehydro-3-deoxygalactonokinase
MAKPAVLIGVDWGTSAFRAFLLDAEGGVLDRRAGSHGILTVTDGDFGRVLSSQVGDWLKARAVPILMSGMIGSRQGWIEAPYVPCPGGLADLAGGLVTVSLARTPIHVVPGMEVSSPSMRDVMRGEETQVFGALTTLGGADGGRFLLPGTHSKWVRVSGGRIMSFSTYMTGEIYAACRDHTILGRLMQDGESEAAFARGVSDGARPGTPGALLHRLFGARTAGLFGEIPGSDLPDYLSGLLIGAEVFDAGLNDDTAVHIIASEALARRYRAAAAKLGLTTAVLDPDCVAAGHLAIARAARLLPM